MKGNDSQDKKKDETPLKRKIKISQNNTRSQKRSKKEQLQQLQRVQQR